MNGRFSDKYFASHEYYSQEYQDAVVDKINAYRDYCESTGKFTKWQRSTQNYYGISTDGTKSSNTVTRAGDDGELIMGKVNDYRNLVQNQLILITSNRPAGIAKAINSDPASLHQSRIGSSLSEYYLSQAGWERVYVKCAEYERVNDEGFFVIDWDTSVGKDVRPDLETGQMIKEGEPVPRVVAPWNMARDPWTSSFDDAKWVIYSYRINKYDLAAKYPQHAETILKAAMMPIKEIPFNPFPDAQSDQIEVFCVSHQRSASVKEGRWSLHIPEVTLQDGPFPYPDWNVYRMAQNDVMDTPFGYSNNNDILAIEECTDAMNSTIITNQLTFGVQSIVLPKGSGFDPIALGKGLTMFELDPNVIDKMRPINFTQTAPELFKYNQELRAIKEQFAGVSSTLRGGAEGLSATSGSQLALIQAQSIKFNSGGQRAYYHVLSKSQTGLIQMLRRFANTKRVIKITGKVQSQYLQDFEFTGDDLSRISSISFEMTDPITQTVGGCLQLADNLLEKGMIKNARQYLTVARTGSLDAFTEDDEADEIAIKSENELLREGQPVMAIATENHQEHIASHMSVISSPESKRNTQLVQAVLSHIQEHLDIWQNLSATNPALLIATKQQVLPVMPGMPVPMGPPPAQGQLPPSQQGPAPDMNPQPPAVQKANEVKPPQMPKNPLTGERAPGPQM